MTDFKEGWSQFDMVDNSSDKEDMMDQLPQSLLSALSTLELYCKSRIDCDGCPLNLLDFCDITFNVSPNSIYTNLIKCNQKYIEESEEV